MHPSLEILFLTQRKWYRGNLSYDVYLLIKITSGTLKTLNVRVADSEKERKKGIVFKNKVKKDLSRDCLFLKKKEFSWTY